MLDNKDITFFQIFQTGKTFLIESFWECFIGSNKVTNESCCYGYPVTKDKQIANNIFWNGMHFVLVKTEREYLKYIQR